MDIKLEKKPWYIRYRYYLTGGLLFISFLIYVIVLSLGPRKLRVDAENIQIAEVKDADFMEYVDVEGLIQPILTIKVNTREAGSVESIVGEEGSLLQQGDTILILSNPDLLRNIEDQRDEWEKQTEMTVQRLYKFSPLYTMGDAARLRQVLRNLLDNALKYNNKTRPKISVSVKTMNADIIVDVQDNGMGIAAEDLEKIFERFYRSERARQQTQQGSGLGLAICRAIVERFGGTLTIKDTALDIGSTFRVTLPILSEN